MTMKDPSVLEAGISPISDSLMILMGLLEMHGKKRKDLVQSLNTSCTKYGIEISAKKTKLMNNNGNDTGEDIEVKGHKLETVSSFKYLGSIISDEGSKPEVFGSNSKDCNRSC